MKIIALIGGLLCCAIFAQAQNLLTSEHQAAQGIVYEIDVPTARVLAFGQRYMISEAWLSAVAMRFPNKKALPDSLPPGQYISTRIIDNKLEWTYLQVPNCNVFVENDHAHLMLRVIDKQGAVVTDALVKVGGVLLPYDPQTQTYLADMRRPKQQVEIEVGGLVQFWDLTQVEAAPRNGNDYSYQNRPAPVRRFLWNPVQQWIIKPVVLTMRLPYDLVLSVVKRKLYGWPALITYRTKQVIRLGRRLAGRANPVTVVACSQPRYRPRDTVQVKALLTDKYGGRIHGKLGVFVTDRTGKQMLVARMQHLRTPGAYTATFTLEDTLNLQLDQDITLSLCRMHGERSGNQMGTARFHYEDYELNEFKLAMRMEASTHWQGKEAVAFLEAKDQNDLTVPDARARLSVMSRVVVRWRGYSLYVPDTLWTWSGNLDASGETRIVIPADRLPAAVLDYEVVGECWSSDNEYKRLNENLHYLHDEGEIKLKQTGSVLSATYWERGESLPQAVMMQIRTSDLLPRKAVQVQLPLELNLSPAWESIHFWVGHVNATWVGSRGGADLQVRGQHLGDTLQIDAASTAGIPFTWHLFEGDRELASGAGPLHYFAPAKARASYHLNVHGTYGGAGFSEDYTYYCPQNRLNVSWEGPRTIYPGMTADMKVQVRDRKGRAVRRADVTAYAVNGRFEGKGGPSVSVRASKARARHLKHDYELRSRASSGRWSGNMPLDISKWELRARLDTVAWYDFLYPGAEIYSYKHPIEHWRTELAPFVVQGGAIQPVQIVYIDGDPVYFAWSTPSAPYSFPTSYGTRHRVELRLPDAKVTLDSVNIQPGYKTILSVDLDQPQKHVQIQKLPNKVQPTEQPIINSRTFAYRNSQYAGPSTISFGADRVFLLNNGSGLLCGPAKGYGEMNLQYADEYGHTISYEPNFEFDFGPKTVKMRTWDNTHMPQVFTYKPSQTVHDRPWVRDSLVAQWKRERNRPPQPQPLNWASYYGSDWGRVYLQMDPTEPPLLAPRSIILHDAKRNLIYVLRADIGPEMRLPQGVWGACLQLEHNRFLTLDSVHIRQKGRNYIRLNYDPKTVQDTLPSVIRSLLRTAPPANAFYSGSVYPSNSSSGRGIEFRYTQSRPTSGRTARLSGIIRDAATGEPLLAAMVYCQGFGVGCYTDLEGHYQMDVPVETDTVVVHYLGYTDQYFRWKGESVHDMAMAESSIMLNEVVVTGSHQHYENLSASADVISVRKVDLQLSSNLQSVLVRSPGVDIIDGLPNMRRDELFSLGGDQDALAPAFPSELLADLGNESVMRSNFRDHAIWEPALRTDKAGESKFRVHFPDDITRWDAYAVAVDRRGRAGLVQAAIKAWKPLAGKLALPRFLMEGDTCLAIGKVLNYTGETVALRRQFRVNGLMEERQGDCGPVQLDTLQLVAPRGTDSLTISYQANRTDGYGDGEERGLGIYPVGILDARGTQAALPGDTTLQVPPFVSDGGPVKVFATTRFQELLLLETERLHNYSHLCNEQLSSKLIALLSEELIFKSMGRPWSGKKDVETCVRMLVKRITLQDDGLLWGWWPGMRAEAWVSLHVTQALLMARAQGYTVPLQTVGWLPGLMNRLHLSQKYDRSNIEVLKLVQLVAPELDIKSQIAALDTLKLDYVTQQIDIMELRQKAGMTIDLDSLDRLMARKMLGDQRYNEGHRLHYSANYTAYQPVYCPIQALLGAYRIKREAGQSSDELAPLLVAILDSRGPYGWTNTYETAQVLITLIPDIGTQAITQRPRVNLVIDGQRRSLTLDSTLVLSQPPSDLRVEKTGYGMVFFTAYQRFFNPQPQPADSLFDIKTTFVRTNQLRASDRIQAGEPLTMHVTINVKRSMDYLMVDVPIPAGCSYGTKSQGYASYGGYGMYREYFRNKVSCYYRQLSAGQYTIDIPLQPRYTGNYVLNCARAEQMYMPLLCGQNAVRRVSIE